MNLFHFNEIVFLIFCKTYNNIVVSINSKAYAVYDSSFDDFMDVIYAHVVITDTENNTILACKC